MGSHDSERNQSTTGDPAGRSPVELKGGGSGEIYTVVDGVWSSKIREDLLLAGAIASERPPV